MEWKGKGKERKGKERKGAVLCDDEYDWMKEDVTSHIDLHHLYNMP